MSALATLQSHNLPTDEYVVIGSAVLEVLGLRQAGDVDLVVTDLLFGQLKAAGWSVVPLEDGRIALHHADDIEAYATSPIWDYAAVSIDPIVVEGIRFVNLEQLMQWKQRRNLPKDQRDVELIQNYLANQDTLNHDSQA